MPNLHIEASDGSTVDLYQIQEDRDERDGMVTTTPIPTYDSDETYLTGMTQSHNTSITGRATGFRLAREDNGYSSDPVIALAEWVQDVMALVDGKQGEGYQLTHDIRDIDTSVVLGSFGWLRSGGEIFDLQWSLEYRIGEGIMVDADPSPATADPGGAWLLDGIDLQYPIEWREEKRQKLETAEMTLAESAEENLVSEDSSPVRTVTINGKHTGTASERAAFDESIKALIGQDQIVSYQSAFPGHTLDVMVGRYESVLEAGKTRVGEYNLELIEGTN